MKKKKFKQTKSNTGMKEDVDPLAGDMSVFIKNAKWELWKFEFLPKNKSVTIRLSEDLLKALKKKAKENGLDYQKFIRLKLEEALNDDAA